VPKQVTAWHILETVQTTRKVIYTSRTSAVTLDDLQIVLYCFDCIEVI